VDYFTKFVFLKPFRDAKARAVCDYIEKEIFLTYGCPRAILVDNGVQYRSREFTSLCARYNVEIRSNIKYTPRNNPTERFNQTVETMIRSYIEANQRTWDAHLSEIQAAVRSGVSEVTRYTPHFLVFGTELILDGRRHLYDGEESDVQIEDRVEFARQCHRREDIFKEVSVRLKEAGERNQKYTNRRRRSFELSKGARLLQRLYTLSNAAEGYAAKLAPRWIGPFRVKKRVGAVSYVLEDSDGREDGPWHIEQLKPYVPRVCEDATC